MERVVRINCEGQSLLGILCTPPSGSAEGRPAVLIVVGGPQYRVGAHRQFVKLARGLAEQGYASLRFDVRGMGDSGGDMRSFEALAADIGAAVQTLLIESPTSRSVVLFGLCDGASAAMLYLAQTKPAPITGLCALNPWVRSPAGLAKAQLQHHYRQRLLSLDFWKRVFAGRVGLASVREFAGKLLLAWQRRSSEASHQALPYSERMALGCIALPGHQIAVMLSGQDMTAQEFSMVAKASPRWSQALSPATVVVQQFAGADHTFSDTGSMSALLAATTAWLSSLGGQATQSRPTDPLVASLA